MELKRLVSIVGFFCCIAAFVLSINDATAQTKQKPQATRRVVQLSGVILAADSITPLPGAHIYVPAAGRGTTSNITGFFSLPLVTGDSLVISFVGYKPHQYVVAENTPEYSTIIIVMSEKTSELPEIPIVAYPTVEVFEQAVLAMNIPLDASTIDSRQLNNELMALMIRTTPMDAAANYRYYMDKYPQDIQNKFMPITNPFLNVFNWAKFFKQMKQQKKEKEAESSRNRIPD